MRRLGLLILGVCHGLGLFAQKDFHFERYTARDGLSHNEVRCMLRDRQGFLWVGTANGLNRFDGYAFQVFLPDPKRANSIGGEAIFSLAEGPDGRIWIAHNRGLDLYDPARDTFQPIAPRPEDVNDWVFGNNCGIFIAPQGQTIIVLNTPYLVLFPPGSQEYEKVFLPDVPPAQRPREARKRSLNSANGVAYKSEAEVWVSTFFGLFSFDLGSKQFGYHPLEGYDWEYGPGPVYYDRQREWAWFMNFSQGLFSYDLRSREIRNWGNVPIGFIFAGLNIALLPDGGVWANYPGVLYPERGEVIRAHHYPDDLYSFPKGSAISALCDRDSILWLGTTAGLVKLDPRLQGFRHVLLDDHPEYDYDNSVFDIFEHPEDGRYYITSFYTGMMFLYDPQSGQSRDISREFRPAIERSATRIFRDSRGLTWLLANERLYQADLPGRRLRAVPMPPLPPGVNDRAAFDIEEDAQGDLWVAKWRAGVLRYSRQDGRLDYVTPPPGMKQPRAVMHLAAGQQGRVIWVGTRGDGVFGIDVATGKWQHFEAVQAEGQTVPVLEVAGLAEDAAGNLWIATPGGLVRYSPNGKARLFTRDDGLANSLLEGMNQDRQGRLWLATGNGITCLDPNTLAIQNYDERHGLKLDAALDGFAVNAAGELFSGTKRGFIRFHPDRLPRDTRPPQLVLTYFKVAGQERRQEGRSAEYWTEARLKHSENFFSIGYVALNFTLAEENEYFYKLDGLHQDWVEAGKQRTAHFAKLPPGRYTFCLKARNKDGVWSSAEKMLDIVVLPPFWRTWWFLALAVMLMLGLGYGAYRLRAAQIRKAEQMKAAFEKKLAEVEMAALRSQMNPHFLFNCLNSINRFIQRNEPDAASAYLSKFSRLIRLVLDNSRSELVSLRDELEALRLYIELEAMRFVGRFAYSLDISPALDLNGIELPPMLLQPYVENAIWHGLMHKESDDCRLWVRAYAEDGRLVLEVEDNGIGREMARQLKSKSATLHKSHGMKVTAERIHIINEIYDAQAEVRIEDLQDARRNGIGTKVTLSLPLN
jgi:ligand-binding sensor domain-containing protein